MVFEDGAFGRSSGLDGIMKAEPWADGVSALIRRDSREFAHCPTTGWEHGRRQLSTSQEENAPETLNSQTLILDFPASRTGRK